MKRHAKYPANRNLSLAASFCWIAFCIATMGKASAGELVRIKYNHPGLVVDLGVGLWAWPLPTDYDNDGDVDLLVACPDKPYNGVYLFENPGGAHPRDVVFRPAKRLGPASHNMTIAHVDGEARFYTPGRRHPELLSRGSSAGVPIEVEGEIHPSGRKTRANQWKELDYDGDGVFDLVVGIGDWTDYGWDNAFDSDGNWTNGPLHGYVYVARNRGTNEKPIYGDAALVEAAGEPIDVYGMPSPNFADFDGDGDLDLVCGDFVDGLHYFENVGSRTKPRYAARRPLEHDGQPMRMELCMIVPVAIDFDLDGDVDLIVGQEDGRVALVEHTGEMQDGLPKFQPPAFLRQQADEVKVGALVTPAGCDWDGDGDDDLLCGNTAGFLEVVENLGGSPPRWAAPRRLWAGGELFRIEAGPNGSIQGPCETKWGYTVPSVADWNGDGLLDVVVNSIWGKVRWLENVGAPGMPELAAPQPVEVRWPATPPKPEWVWWQPEGMELATQWRTTPAAIDWNQDGLMDLVMLDHEGYLAFFERTREDGQLALLPGRRIFLDDKGQPLRLNPGVAGRSGRRKFVFHDYDGDGRLDLIINSKPNVDWYRGAPAAGEEYRFANQGALADRVLAGHTTCPTTMNFDGDSQRDIIVGGEDGFLYRLVP